MIVLMTMMWSLIDYINSYHSFLYMSIYVLLIPGTAGCDYEARLRPKSHRPPGSLTLHVSFDISNPNTHDIPCSTFDIHEAPPLITFPSHFDGQFSRLNR